MLKKKILQKGFTIVELLIVIVVIGILAALVLNTFAGVQKRARDTERQTDLNSISTQLEAYYAKNGQYPVYTVIDAETEIKALLPGVDIGAFSPPQQAFSTTAWTSTVSASKDVYGYQAFTDAAKTTPCTLLAVCINFTLSGVKEEGGAFTKNSLN